MMNIFGKKKKSFSIDKKDSLESLLLACSSGSHEVVLKILQQGSFFVNGTDDSGRSPLHVSSLNGHLKVVQVLISFGADLNQNDNNGWTPLHCAATSRYGYLRLVLIRRNAELFLFLINQEEIKVDVQNEDNNTPLHYLSKNPCEPAVALTQIVNVLVKKSTNINAFNINGETPLHNACMKGYWRMVELLIRFKADLNARNDHGETPLHYCARMGHEKCVELLLKAGADPNLEGEDGIPLAVTPTSCESIQSLLLNWQQLRSPSPSRLGASPTYHSVLGTSPPSTSFLFAPVDGKGNRGVQSNHLVVPHSSRPIVTPRLRLEAMGKTRSSPLLELSPRPQSAGNKESALSSSLQESLSLNDIILSPRNPFNSSAPISISPAISPRPAEQRWSPGSVVKSPSHDAIQESEKRFSLAELRRNTMSGETPPIIKPKVVEDISLLPRIFSNSGSSRSLQSSGSSTPSLVLSSEDGVSSVFDIGAALTINNSALKTRSETKKATTPLTKSRKGSKRMSIHQTGGTFKEDQLKLLVSLASNELLKYLSTPPVVVPSDSNPIDPDMFKPVKQSQWKYLQYEICFHDDRNKITLNDTNWLQLLKDIGSELRIGEISNEEPKIEQSLSELITTYFSTIGGSKSLLLLWLTQFVHGRSKLCLLYLMDNFNFLLRAKLISEQIPLDLLVHNLIEQERLTEALKCRQFLETESQIHTQTEQYERAKKEDRLEDAISMKRSLEALKIRHLQEENLISQWRADPPATHISFDKILRKVATLPDNYTFMEKFANVDIVSLAKNDLEKAAQIKQQAEQIMYTLLSDKPKSVSRSQSKQSLPESDEEESEEEISEEELQRERVRKMREEEERWKREADEKRKKKQDKRNKQFGVFISLRHPELKLDELEAELDALDDLQQAGQ